MARDRFKMFGVPWGDAPLRTSGLSTFAAAMVMMYLISQVRYADTAVYIAYSLVLLAFFRWPVMPLVSLVFVMVVLFVIPGHFLGVVPRRLPPLSAWEVALSAAFLAYISLHYRFLSQCRDIRREQTVETSDDLRTPSTNATSGMQREYIADVLAIVVAALLVALSARWVLPLLFVGRTLFEAFRMNPGLVGFLFATLVLGIASLIWPALVRTVGRMGMSPLEGRMILDEWEHRGMQSELSLIQRQLARRRLIQNRETE